MQRVNLGAIAIILAASLTAGCDDPAPGPEPAPPDTQTPDTRAPDAPLQVDHADGRVTGSFVAPNAGVLAFESVRVHDRRVDLVMLINDRPFEWSVDDKSKVQTSTGAGAVLEDRDVALLRAFQQAMGAYLTSLADPAPELQLPAIAASYWAIAPRGYQHRAREALLDGSGLSHLLGDDGKSCVAIGSTWTVAYDDEAGNVECDEVTVGDDWGPSECSGGDYDCMGRCGGGCGGFGGGWTLDCLEHDVCSHNKCASGGGSDNDCGDEYDDAYDDFTAHMWGGGSCSSGDSNSATPGVDPSCGGSGGGGGGPVCGDGTVEAPEACDGGECCESDCTISADGSSCSVGTCQAGACEASSGGGGDTIDETGLAGSAGTELFFEMTVPAGATGVTIAMSGGSGDADLHVKLDGAVSTSNYDCRPYEEGNDETCTFAGPGTYSVLVRGYSTFSGVSLQGTYTTDGGDPATTVTALDETGLSGGAGSNQVFDFTVPAGGSDVVIDMSGTSGDADLYVKVNGSVSTSSYDCRPYLGGSNESCTFSGPGTYSVLVNGYSTFSGVSLQATYLAP